MADELKVPAQLETQLAKCKTVRKLDSYKPRTKSAAVRSFRCLENVQHTLLPFAAPISNSTTEQLLLFIFSQEIKASKKTSK